MRRLMITFALLLGSPTGHKSNSTTDEDWMKVFVTTYVSNNMPTAGGDGIPISRLRYRRSRSMICALSRDLLSKFKIGGRISFGDSIEIEGPQHFKGRYLVQDVMAAKWPKRCRYKGAIRHGVDILIGQDEYKIGGRWNNIRMRVCWRKSSGSRTIIISSR
jgi:hypothetical protein